MRHRRKVGSDRLGIVVGQFPCTSETFILREMFELQQRGFDLAILSLSMADGESEHSEATALAPATVYRPRPGSALSLLQQLGALCRYPAGYASALFFVLRHSFASPGNARELLNSLLAAGSFAARAPGRKRLGHVHAQFCSIPATVGMLLAEMMGITFSISCHARDLFTRESILMATKLTEAEFTAVCTEHGLARLRRQYPLVAGDNIHLVHHGIAPERFPPPTEPAAGPTCVLSVGRLIEKKGFGILLRAAALARADGAQFVLEIVGDGPEREDIERLAAGLGLREVVILHGRLTQDELLPIYARAHAFVLASVVAGDGDRDGIPNVLLEAMAMGVPVLATTAGGIPELVQHEVTGLLSQPGDVADLADQLQRIVYDEDLRARVRQAAREKVLAQFDISRNVEQLAALFAQYVSPDEDANARAANGRA